MSASPNFESVTHHTKLLFVTPRFGRGTGGLGVSAERIVGHLRTRYDVEVLTERELLPVDEPCGPHAKGISRLAPRRDGKIRLQEINDWVESRSNEPRIAGVLGFYAGPWSYAALLAARRRDLPFATFARGNDIDLDLFGENAFHAHYLLTHAQRTFCVTTELADKIRSFAPSAATQFIANGVNPERFDYLDPDLRTGHAIIGIFGDLKQKKGLTFLLENLDFSTHRLRMVGSLRDESAKILHGFLSVHPDLAPQISQTSFVQSEAEIIREYAACDVVCIPSLHEGMANVMLESMACGKVVIASRVGGALDVIESGKNGFLFDLSDPKSFFESMEFATKSARAEGNPIGHAARESVRRGFTQARERTRYLEAIEELLRKAPRAFGYTEARSRSLELG